MVILMQTLPVRAMSLEKQFGKNVRYWRLKREMSQEVLAERASLHPTYVSGVESGKRNPTVNVIGRIANALDIKPAVLFE